MKISKIVIDNLYGIKHVELDGSPVELRGRKGTGKTSVIDAIKLALTNRSNRDYIIHDGEREGEILIKTDCGIDINRKKRTDSGDYNKITNGGKPIQSPQSFLDGIFTPLQLNPIEFASWDKNAQNRAILDLIQFEWDINWIKEQFGELPSGVDYNQHILKVLDDIQSQNGDYWKRREIANRNELYKRQTIQEVAAKLPVGYDVDFWKSFDLRGKSAELQKAQLTNQQIERAKQFAEQYHNKIRGYCAEKDISISSAEQAISIEKAGLVKSIERLKAEIAIAEEKLTGLTEKLVNEKKIAELEYNEKVAKLDGDVQIANQYKDKQTTNISPLQAEIDKAITMKEYVSEYQTMQRMVDECKQLKIESTEITEKINTARSLPGKILESAELPIENLTVVNGEPRINGLPISNLSDGEKIELCVDIALSQKTNIAIILLNGVESLDDDSRNKLYRKCIKHGVQVIAAKTTNDDAFTIYELDGDIYDNQRHPA